MEWLEFLVPPEPGENIVLDALDNVPFEDDSTRVSPGALDKASLSLVYRALTQPGLNLVLQLPRGAHDFAIFCGLFAQLTRLLAKARPDAFPPGSAFAGPVVVVGMNTMVQERLRRIRIGNVSLAEGLAACRVRSDGRVVASSGAITRVAQDDQRIFYLNTRVGWPKLQQLSLIGAVVIDRTSFTSPEILERALVWAEEHRARNIIVVTDLGDEGSIEIVNRTGGNFAVWPWSQPLIDVVVDECGRAESESPLSTNPLLWQDDQGPQVIACVAPALDEGFRTAFAHLVAARAVDAPAPRPLDA